MVVWIDDRYAMSNCVELKVTLFLLKQKIDQEIAKYRNNKKQEKQEKEEIMKNGIGIIRKIDELGRIVVPIEIRRAFDINSQDAVEIHTTEEGILLKKHTDSCIFCGNDNNIVIFKDKKICSDCVNGVTEAKN